MTGLWLRGQYYVVPDMWDCFTADGWTVTRVRGGFRATRLGLRPYTVRVA